MRTLLGVPLLLLTLLPIGSGATTARLSVATDGTESNGDSLDPAVSADGRFVAFWSFADNLVPDDHNETCDVFVRDRERGTTERVSIAFDGSDANGCSLAPSISGDGRFVAFESIASNLTRGDTNGCQLGDTNGRLDVFVHDRTTNATTRVSVTSTGADLPCESSGARLSADGSVVAFRCLGIAVHDRRTGETAQLGDGFDPAISGDGRFVAFVLVESNATTGIFLHDRVVESTTRVSATTGELGNGDSGQPALSFDGRFVAFASAATNLVPDDTRNGSDVFVYDRDTGKTECASVVPDGLPGGTSHIAGLSISGNGQLVAYSTLTPDLVEGDTNGADDIFTYNQGTGVTKRVSISSLGQQANHDSVLPFLSADGRVLAFVSAATNLVEDDHNVALDVFVSHERLCANEGKIAQPLLRITGARDRDGRSQLLFAGDIAAPQVSAYRAAVQGAQLLLEDLGSGGTAILELTDDTYPVPPAGAACDAQADGWTTAHGGVIALYRNRSGAIDPPKCTPGSSSGLRLLRFRERRRQKRITFAVLAKIHDLPKLAGPLRGTIVLGSSADEGSRDSCASHTFVDCWYEPNNGDLTCR